MFDELDDPVTHEFGAEFRSTTMRVARRRRRARRLSVLASATAVSTVMLAVAGFVYVRQRDMSIDRVQFAAGTLAREESGGPITFVLLGKDEPTDSGQRADSIDFVRFDPSDGSVRAVSIPRDLVDPRTNRRIADTMSDGPQAVVDSVQMLVPLPINHFVALDFDGFVDLVDEFGGVHIAFQSPVVDTATGLSLPAGCSTLDGHTALALVRSRHLENPDTGAIDPSADFGRIQRQQAFIEAVLRQLHSAPDDPLALDRYARILGQHAQIDSTLDLTHLVDLAHQLRSVDPSKVDARILVTELANGSTVSPAPYASDAARAFLVDGTPPPEPLPPLEPLPDNAFQAQPC